MSIPPVDTSLDTAGGTGYALARSFQVSMSRETA